VDLQKQVRDEITYLANDMERRLNEAASKAATERVYAFRLATMAKQALDRSTSGQQVLPEALRRDLHNIIQSDGTERKHAEKVLADVLAWSIGSGGAPVLTSEQRALAERLGAGNKAKPLEEWLKDNMPEAETGALKSQEAIEELALLAGEEAAPFAARHRRIAAEPPGTRRQMLADTLMLDVSTALASAKARTEQLRTLELQSASLSAIEAPEAKKLQQRINAVLGEQKSADAAALTTQISEFIERQRKVAAAKAQRSAILAALKGIGHHRVKYLDGYLLPHEIEDNDVLAHPIEQLWPIDHLLEMFVDLAPDLLLYARIVLALGDVEYPLTSLIEAIDPKIGGK
jgi:hypothetical protein